MGKTVLFLLSFLFLYLVSKNWIESNGCQSVYKGKQRVGRKKIFNGGTSQNLCRNNGTDSGKVNDHVNQKKYP